MAPTVFFIGLGNMGWGMSKNIVEKANLDKPLIVYNRSRDRAAAFSSQFAAGKVVVADSIAAGVAGADVVWTMLSNDAIVEGVVDEALAAADCAGKLFIQSATIHPDTTERLAAKVEARGAAFVAAPVFGAPVKADAGELVGVLAGSGAALDRARPFFQGVTARAEVLMRDAPVAHALLLKVIGNSFVFNLVEQLAEGYVLSEKTGLGTAPLRQLMGHMFPGPYVDYSDRMLSGHYHRHDRPLFGVDLALKDVGFALQMGAAHGVPLPNAQAADAHLMQVKAHDGEAGDVAAIYGAVRQEAGLPYENLE